LEKEVRDGFRFKTLMRAYAGSLFLSDGQSIKVGEGERDGKEEGQGRVPLPVLG